MQLNQFGLCAGDVYLIENFKRFVCFSVYLVYFYFLNLIEIKEMRNCITLRWLDDLMVPFHLRLEYNNNGNVQYGNI